MFRVKRLDTKIATVESTYGINLNARGDALLGNLLRDRGFDSLSQLLDAYYCRLKRHARKRRTFISFHAEDWLQVQGFRLMAMNSRVDLDIYDSSIRVPINSVDGSYIKDVIREKIHSSSVIICLIGNGTAWRDWVDWEICCAYEMRKGVCGVRLKGSRGRTPPALLSNGAPIATWELGSIIAAIECAAARRS
jgi:MTH538 TIR-like domain (DUF1863)